MKKIYQKILVILLPLFGSYISYVKAQTVDATTMDNKVMAGYQGWFRTPGDADGNRGWAHLFNGSVPSPPKLAFDTWPDMSELSKKEKYPVPGFTYADGSQAYLYSAQHYQTVLRHFEWMRQYGIDGVWLSEFCGHFPGGGAQADSTAVLNIMNNVRKAAKATGRTWAFMWDMSGLSNRLSKQKVFDIIVDQWKKMVDEGVTADDRYMHEHGKPVLLIWGFFPGRPASQPEYMNPVIDFLLAPGKYQATLVGGVDPNWRAQGTTEFQAMLMRMQGLQPWSVGRRIKDPATGYAVQNMTLWKGDIQKCKENNVMFMPVFNSGTHIAGPPPVRGTPPTVPRRMGNYLWEQFMTASKYGLKSVFVAMFDEINEGTQIMKIDLHPPVQAAFFTYDGATSDYYLRLIGTGAKLLKKGGEIAPDIPISPFDEKQEYHLKNIAGGKELDASGVGVTTLADTGTGNQWLIHFDRAGYFELQNKATGKFLSNQQAGVLIDKSAKTADMVKWHLEWGGTDYCHIISKENHHALAIGENGQLILTIDPLTDKASWQIAP